MRAALEAAISKHDGADEEAPEVEAAPVELEAAPEVDAEAAPEVEAAPEAEPVADGRDEKGRFKPKIVAEPAQKVAQKPGATQEQQAAPPEQKPAVEALKAPTSLKASAREAWSKAPRELQEDMIRIDREVRQVMQESAGARQFGNQFKEMISPYVSMIRAEQRGRAFNPLEAISSVMDTAVALRQGQPSQKAELLAEMIESYGIPIEMLDAALTRRLGGKPAAGEQPRQSVADFRDPRLDQLIQEREQEKEARRSEVFEQGRREVQDFATKAEFYEDVKPDMARLIAAANAANESISLQEAYDTALSLPKHKSIQGILQQREAAKAIDAKKRAQAKARAAGSTVRGSPTGSAIREPATNTRREAIEAAMSSADER